MDSDSGFEDDFLEILRIAAAAPAPRSAPPLLPARPPPNLELTALARIYGHPVGDFNKILAYTGKSGLTPIEPPPRGPPYRTIAEELYLQTLEKYQRIRSRGFATAEFHDQGAFAPWFNSSNVDLATLERDFPIHPIYQQERWSKQAATRTRPRFRLPGGGLGYWDALNDNIVWEAISPVLRIASQILNNSHSFAWFQMLLEMNISNIDDAQLPDKWKGRGLTWLNPPQTLPDFASYHAALMQRKYDIDFDFYSGCSNPLTGMADPAGFTNGITRVSVDAFDGTIQGDSTILLAYETYVPFLRTDLTAADRKLDYFRAAVILVHETCHAIFASLMKGRGGDMVEPYVRGDGISELGYSMENELLGGSPVFLTERATYQGSFGPGWGHSAAALMSKTWFHQGNHDYKEEDLPSFPSDPLDWQLEYRFPIPMTWIEDHHDPSYWKIYVRKFGSAATKMGPKTYGIRKNYKIRASGATRYFHIEDPSILNATLSDQVALDFENRRREQSAKIIAAVKAGAQRNRTRNQLTATMRQIPGMEDQFGALGFFPDPSMVEPPPLIICPVYDVITNYLLANRAQNELCLDSMDEFYPEHVLLEHILRYSAGGFYLTPETWNLYLRTCQSRGEHFNYRQNMAARGECQWIEELDPALPLGPTDRVISMARPCDIVRMQLFQNIIVTDDAQWILRDDNLVDWEPTELLDGLNEYAELLIRVTTTPQDRGIFAGWVPFQMDEVEGFVDAWESAWDDTTLFVWGTNGVIRRYGIFWDRFFEPATS